jgi:hypothetical protein
MMYFQIYRRNASSPNTMVMQWSTDGTTYNTGITYDISGRNDIWLEELFDLTSLAGMNYKSTLYFRLYINDLNGNPLFGLDNFQLIAQNDEIVNATVTPTNALCNSQASGTITINNTNSGIWEYSRNGGFTWQDANVFNGLSAGIYDVIMREKSNPACNVALNRELVITQPSAIVSATNSVTNAVCNGSSTGSATVSATGGTGTYTYSWNSSPVQTAATATNLPAGNYVATITDGNGCTSTQNITINQNAAIAANLATASTTVCASASTALVVNVTGSGSFTGSIAGSSFSGNAPATVTVNVTPSATTTYTITSFSTVGTYGACPSSPTSGSTTVTVPNGAPGVWTGSVSTDWFNCANWANGVVPDNSVDVQLATAAARNVIIDPTSPFAPADKIARAKNIIIDKNLSFNNAGALYLAGNWQNNLGVSGFSAGTGEVRFMSSSSKQTINTSGASEIFNKLTIANTSNQATSDEVTLLKPVTISPTGVFTLVKGRLLTTSVNSLTLTNDAPAGMDAVGAGNDTYVNGPMSWNALFTGGEYTFPVGKPNGPYGAYRPVGIIPNIPASPGVAQTTTYTSEYFPKDGPGIISRNFLGILKTEHWEIARPVGNLDAVVKLIYIKPNSGDWLDVDPCSTCNVAVAKQYGATWYFTNYTNTSSGFNMSLPNPETRWSGDASGPVYSKLLSNFSPFTFGFDYNVVLGNPQINIVRIKSFNAKLNGVNGELDWNLEGASIVQKVDLEYSTDGTSFTKLSSFGPTLYGFYQYTHQQLSAGKHYYRLVVFYNQTGKQVSETRILEVGKFKTVIHDLPITVVRSQLMIDIHSAASQAFETRILSTNGALLSTYQGQLNMGSNKQPINIPFLPQGLYIVQVRTQDGVSRTMKFMKE